MDSSGVFNPQESGGACHPDTYALGSKSGQNDVRDFWRFVDTKIVTRLMGIAKG